MLGKVLMRMPGRASSRMVAVVALGYADQHDLRIGCAPERIAEGEDARAVAEERHREIDQLFALPGRRRDLADDVELALGDELDAIGRRHHLEIERHGSAGLLLGRGADHLDEVDRGSRSAAAAIIEGKGNGIGPRPGTEHARLADAVERAGRRRRRQRRHERQHHHQGRCHP